MADAQNPQPPILRGQSAEVAWMAAALQAAQASESRFRALAQMIRDGWPDDRIIALDRTLYPDARILDRSSAMTAIDGLFQQPHPRLLLELLLADPQAGLPSVASPFRAR
jgi:hypothetical protein